MEYEKSEDVIQAVIPKDGATIDEIEPDKWIIGLIMRLNKDQKKLLEEVRQGNQVFLKLVKIKTK